MILFFCIYIFIGLVLTALANGYIEEGLSSVPYTWLDRVLTVFIMPVMVIVVIMIRVKNNKK